MNWQQFLLSPQGRVGRQHYWLMVLISIPFICAASWAGGGFDHLWDPPGAFFLLPIIWPSLVISIKRWHDRNKSGWWVLVGLIPIVGDIWVLVENGFLRGTLGDNRFGPE
jgi:uncharacterized membrane protein YhaH (DUF805 family)